MTALIEEATDAEILAAVRAGALLGDRVDLAIRFGRHLLESAARDREQVAVLGAVRVEAAQNAAVASRTAAARELLRLRQVEDLVDRAVRLEGLLQRACVNGGGALLREAELS